MDVAPFIIEFVAEHLEPSLFLDKCIERAGIQGVLHNQIAGQAELASIFILIPMLVVEVEGFDISCHLNLITHNCLGLRGQTISPN